MDTQLRHPMLVKSNHDENVRQQFVHNLRLTLASDILPGNRTVYDKRVKPNFKKETGRDPKDRHEIRQLMSKDSYYRLYSATQRSSQEMMWDAVIDSVERENENLNKLAKNQPNISKGTCNTDFNFKVPKYHLAADIHLQPGGYHWQKNEKDITSGAVYDRSVYIYSVGGLGDMNDDLGKTLINYFIKNFPDKKPEKILDMGCAVGHSTIPWSKKFTDSKVYGIDCGGGMIRYAHARAQYLNTEIHFSQQNAEQTNFKDSSFDVICSHIMLHETSSTAFLNILKECYRLLKPGGIMMHLDLPRDEGMEKFNSFLMDWEAYNNNETFLVRLRDMNWIEETKKAGFSDNKIGVDFSKTNLAEEAIRNGETPKYSGAFPILIGEK